MAFCDALAPGGLLNSCEDFIRELSETFLEINDLHKATMDFQELEHNREQTPQNPREISRNIMKINDLRKAHKRWAETPSRPDSATASQSRRSVCFSTFTMKILPEVPKTKKPTVGFLVRFFLEGLDRC